MSAKHTPGPWTIYTGSDADEHRRAGWVLVMAGGNAGRIVANINAESCPDSSSAPATVKMPAEANARLIAAAPELLEALKLDLLFHSRPLCRQSLPDFKAAGYMGTDDGKQMRDWLNAKKDAALAKATEGQP